MKHLDNDCEFLVLIVVGAQSHVARPISCERKIWHGPTKIGYGLQSDAMGPSIHFEDCALLELAKQGSQQGSLTQEQALEQHDLFCQERFGMPLWHQLETAFGELYEWMVHGKVLFSGPSPMFLHRQEEPNNEEDAQQQEQQAPAGLAAPAAPSNQSQSASSAPTSTPNSLDSSNQSPSATTTAPYDSHKDGTLHLSSCLSVLLQRDWPIKNKNNDKLRHHLILHPQRYKSGRVAISSLPTMTITGVFLL